MITLTIGKTKKHPVDTSRYMTDTMQISAVLKESVDIKAPIFKVNFDPSNYNYISWAREDGPTRYYWIDNTVYIHNNLFEIHCSLDLMATYYDVIQHGLTGKLLYSTYELDWDEYFDDLRFSPSSLDVYDYLPWGDKSNDWLHTSTNVFGDAANMWSISYDSDHNPTYGEGMYIVQASSDKGPKVYLFNAAAFTKFVKNVASTFWGQQWTSPISAVDAIDYIKVANWLPINLGALVSQMPSGSAIAHPTWYVGVASVGTSDIMEGEVSYEIPFVTVLQFSGEIVVPQNEIEHPTWMENSRWNSLTLNTPSGNTEINLDYMYPVSNQHNRIQFSTVFDVVDCQIDTKFTYDVKGHWSNVDGTPIYESDFNIGMDMMNLVQKYFNVAERLVSDITIGVGAAAAAFSGGMAIGAAGGGAGLAKMKAASKMKESGINLTKNGTPIAQSIMQQGVSESLSEMVPLAKTAVIGAAATKLVPNFDRQSSNISVATNRASLYNTADIGAVSLRLKPFRCKELAYTAPESSDYPTPKAKYIHYCEQFGYPANKFIRNLYLNGQPGTLYVFEDAHLDLSDVNTLELNGITDEEMNAIEQIAKSGFWYNVV